MIITVGESINTSRPAVEKMVLERNAEAVQALAMAQVKAGATYLDVNCGTCAQNEVQTMQWLVDTIQAVTDIPLCIDSPEAEPLAMGLSMAKNGHPLMNSITGETKVFESILPVVRQYKPRVIALCIDDTGIPTKAEERFAVAQRLILGLRDAGIPDDDIFIDPLIQPISANDQAGIEVMKTLQMISQAYPKVHKICGLSNISFGAPNRKLLNRIFTILTMASGMDAYVLNPLDRQMMGAIVASQALMGCDAYCLKYIKAHRAGLYD